MGAYCKYVFQRIGWESLELNNLTNGRRLFLTERDDIQHMQVMCWYLYDGWERLKKE